MLPVLGQESAKDEKSKVLCVGLGITLVPVHAGLVGLGLCSRTNTDRNTFAVRSDSRLKSNSITESASSYPLVRPASAGSVVSPQNTTIQAFSAPRGNKSDSNTSPATSTPTYGAILCRWCSDTFCDTSTRNRHEKLHNPVSFDIACSSCGKTFGRNDNCLKHIRNHHAGATEAVTAVKVPKLA